MKKAKNERNSFEQFCHSPITGMLSIARKPENPVFRIIKALSNKPDGWFDLRDIDRRFYVSEQEQGP
jgi:hypothetical protein